MPLVPFRGLGTRGIVKDLPPTDLPLEAYTGGNNVRFSNGASMRAPSWRSTNTGLAFVPSGAFQYVPPNGADVVFVPTDTGRIWSRNSGGALTDVTIAGHVDVSGTSQFTGCALGGIQYLNRETHVPVYYASSSTDFAPIPAWDATHRTEVLRSFRDFLVAFNVIKAGTTYPTMVKWSDVALAGAPPASWDHTDPTKLAGETILAEIQGPIVDATNLRDAMVVYGQREVWLMEFIGGQFIFRFRRIFDDGGILNRNCAIEVQGKHYVFGIDDIYVHDGVQRMSIAEGRVRDFVFRNIDLTAASRCFVAHNVNSKEIMFCYVSGDQDIATGFSDGTGVNRAVVYCYANDTWGIMDLPNVFGPMALSPASQALIYSAATMTYAEIGGSYQDASGGLRRALMATVRSGPSSISSDRLSLLDNIEVGSLAQFPLDTELLTSAFLEKEHIDLDTQGAELTMFKTVSRVIPQMRMPGASTVDFRFGASDIHGQSPTWEDTVTYDPLTEYKVDTRVSGRYLALRLTVATANDFALSGFDADIRPNGNR